MHKFIVFAIACCWFVLIAESKIYDRCELAKELLDVHEIPEKQIATWVCIAQHESNFNTSAINQGSGDHGLLQISQLFWCSPPGYACGVSCNDMRNDDIEDDVICARRIFREHKRLTGDGFNAWVVYGQYCRGDVSRYISGCDDGNAVKADKDSEETTTKSPSTMSEVLSSSSTSPEKKTYLVDDSHNVHYSKHGFEFIRKDKLK